MPFEWWQVAAASATLLIGSMLQGTIGFASGLFTVPVLLLAGFEPTQAVTLQLVASLVQNVTAVVKMHESIPWRLTARPIILRLITLPIGVWLLSQSDTWDRDFVKQIIGGVLLTTLVLQWVLKVEPREKLPVFWELLAFSAAGFLLGFCGMGGPPMILWVMAHNWKAAKARAFQFFVFLSGIVPQAILVAVMLGWSVVPAALLGLALVPFSLLGTYLGLRVGGLLPTAKLRMVAYAVLLITGITSVASPYLSFS